MALNKSGVVYEPHDYARRQLTSEELADIVGNAPPASFVNPRSPAFRRLGISHDDLEDEMAIEIMGANNVLVRRPVVVHGDQRIIGLDADAYERLARQQQESGSGEARADG